MVGIHNCSSIQYHQTWGRAKFARQGHHNRQTIPMSVQKQKAAETLILWCVDFYLVLDSGREIRVALE